MATTTDLPHGDDSHDPHNGNDVELRELVYQTLERDGLITRLKAQLRAAVFKTIEKASSPSGAPSTPAYDSQQGRVCRALIHDWLEHARLLYTQDIFQVETSAPNRPGLLTHDQLIEQLHLDTAHNRSQPLLHALLNQRSPSSTVVTSLPEHIKQSIDARFPTEKINDLNRVREHFRSLFTSAFDSSVLDAFLNKAIPSSSTSIPKFEYEQICLKWMQACAKTLAPPTSSPTKPASRPAVPQPEVPTYVQSNGSTVTRARRVTSPPSESISSSSSPTTSENPRRGTYDFPLPTTMNGSKPLVKKSTDVPPPPLLNFNVSGTNDDDDDDDTSSSIFSRRNATPADLNRLKNIEDIIRGDETPRTRTTIDKLTNNGNKDLHIEYDDESCSQSQMSSVDDITVEKASPSHSAPIDYLEDL